MLFQTTENGSTGLNTVMEITHDRKVKINGSILNVPDYVFEDGYELMSLEQLEESIEENNHLPGMPSAVEVEENGISVGEMQRIFLEKIEELTLYVIEQEKRINALEQENNKLRK